MQMGLKGGGKETGQLSLTVPLNSPSQQEKPRGRAHPARMGRSNHNHHHDRQRPMPNEETNNPELLLKPA